MSKRSSTDGAAAVGLAVMVLVVLLVLVWLAVEAVVMVVRTIAAHPGNKPLWCAMGVATIATLLLLLSAGQIAVINLFAGIAVGNLVLTAWGVQTYHDTLLKRAVTGKRLVQEVLGPWW